MSTLVIVGGVFGIITGVGMIAIVFPASLLSFFAARRATSRLDDLIEVTQRIRRGQTSARVSVEGEDEVAQLQADFNTMAETLEQALNDLQAERDSVTALLDSRRTLFASVSHELRTPVATLRGYLEAIQRHAASDPDLASDVEVMARELLRLQRLIDDVFTLARLDVEQLRLDRRAVEVSNLLVQTVKAARIQAWQTGKIDILLDCESPLPLVLIDEMRLEQVLHNLIRNAVRHTLSGGMVVVSAEAESTYLRIDVKDTGEGIAPESLAHVWERFYQAGQQKHDPDSAGLGLSIVKEIVEAMDGTVAADSQPGTGSIFTIRLPRVLPY